MTGQALKSLVESMFEVVRDRSTPEELAIVCPVPGCGDQSGNRGVSLKNGKTHCWRCNTGGDFVRWAKWLGYAFDDNETIAVTPEELCLLLEPPKPKLVVPVINPISLPKGFHPCFDNPDSAFTKAIGEMARRKNLELEDLVMEGVGYVLEDQKWEPFAVFPVLEFERLVYFQGRTYWDEPGVSTKKFPSRVEAPLSSRYWLYDIDRLRQPEVDTVVIVESILNVASLKKKFAELGVTNMIPVCVFKHAISKPQFYKLLRFKNIKEAILLFDFDAIDLSWEEAKKIDDLIRVSIAEMPLSAVNRKLDPNDDVDAAWAAIERREPYSLAGRAVRKINTAAEYFSNPDLHSIIVDLTTQPS
jgi:hypothetical protein